MSASAPSSHRTQLGRQAVAAVLLAAALLFALLNLTLHLIFGAHPAQLARAELVSPEAQDQVRSRLAALAVRADLERPLVVVLGLSTAREGVSPSLVEASSGQRLRLLNLAQSGGSFTELAAYAEPLLVSAAPPVHSIVVGLHPSWLAGRRGAPMITETAALSRLREQTWVLAQRPALQATARAALYRARGALQSMFDLSPRVRNPAAYADPWRVEVSYADARAPQEFWDSQLREWRAMGWFDANRLGTEAPDAAELSALLRALRQRCSRLIVVLMPEASSFRSLVPAHAGTTIEHLTRAAGADIVVLDWRERLPDLAFRDQAHPNAMGRSQLSTDLGYWLAANAPRP